MTMAYCATNCLDIGWPPVGPPVQLRDRAHNMHEGCIGLDGVYEKETVQ